MILLQRWLVGRPRTYGRFWRAVRRIDQHSIDWLELWLRLVGAAICALFLFSLGGCASTGTILRVGLHADVTDVVTGCDRKRDAACGLLGPRDIAVIELLYAPGLQLRRPIEPYCSLEHNSHYSAGKPFNNEFEQVLNTVGCGGFIQFGERQ